MHLIRDLFSIAQITTQTVIDIQTYPTPRDRASFFEETIQELHLYRRIRRPWTDADKAAVTRLEATALATLAASVAFGDSWPQQAIDKQLEERGLHQEKGDPFSWRTPDVINDTTEIW